MNNSKNKPTEGKSKAVKNLWIIFGSVLLFIILFFFCVAVGIFGKMPSFDELENPRTNLATEIYSADGKLLGSYFVENRSNVRYSELSHYMPEALISIEDERFTEHSGIDEKALFRVAFGVITGNKRGGGSTITQQLAKNLFPRGENLSTPKLVLRKFKEWITVAFGHNAYGIRSAANTFFDKNPKDLNLEECALMAGVVNAPTRYSPIRNPERSLGRRNLVLQKMVDNGFITQEECDSVSQIPIDMSHFNVSDHNTGQATYFREFLRGYLNDWAKNTTRADGEPYNIYRDGLRIYTTIDSRMQRYAEDAVKDFMSKELQPMFFNHWKGYKNAPFSNVSADEIDHILETSMKRSDRYRSLKNSGMCMDSIKAEFNRPVPMTIFSWNGPIDTVMSPMDSIRYYKWYLQASLVSIESHTGHDE